MLSRWFDSPVGSPAAGEKEPAEPSRDKSGTFSDLVPYDENLLERSRTQWQFGDWDSLAGMEREKIEHHPDRAKLALLAAAGRAQLGRAESARQFVRLARNWGCGKQLISRIMIAGVHNSLARAAAAGAQEQRALRHFETSVAIGTPGGDVGLLTQGRVMHQLDRMPSQISLPSVRPLLEKMKSEKGAVSHPPKAGEKPAGSADKYETLAFIHQMLRPELYLEIGVQQGKSLALASCEAIGIDPVPHEHGSLGPETKIINSTSDEFFAEQHHRHLKRTVDLALIDGMHLFEYALRDFMNLENLSNSHSLVVVADVYPKDPEQARRRRSGPDWLGDLWKLPAILSKYRPDLIILGVDVPPAGLFLIAGLDPGSSVLEDSYREIVGQYSEDTEPPAEVLSGHGAIGPDDAKLAAFLEPLREAGANGLSRRGGSG